MGREDLMIGIGFYKEMPPSIGQITFEKVNRVAGRPEEKTILPH